MVMQIKTYDGPLDPGFSGYTQQGVVDKSAAFEGMDLAGFAGMAKTGIEGAVAFDTMNKVATASELANQLANDYLQSSPTHQNYLRNELIKTNQQLETETDPLVKSELGNKVNEITNKLENGLKQGRMDSYEFTRRLNSEIGTIVRNNPAIAPDILRRVNQSLQISGVNAAIQMDTTLLGYERTAENARRTRIDTYLTTNKVPHDLSASYLKKEQLVEEHMLGQSLLQQLEDDKKQREFARTEVRDAFIENDGLRILSDAAMYNAYSAVEKIMNDPEMPIGQKRERISFVLDQKLNKYQRVYDKMERNPAITDSIEMFKRFVDNVKNIKDENLNGKFLAEATNNFITINKNDREMKLMETMDTTKLEMMVELSKVLKNIADVPKGAFGGSKDSLKANALTTIIKGMQNYANDLFPGVSDMMSNTKNPETNKTNLVSVTETLIKNNTPSNNPGLIEIHKWKENKIQNFGESQVQLTNLDDSMSSYGSDAYKGKLNMLAQDTTFQELLESNFQDHIKYTKQGFKQHLGDKEHDIRYNPETGMLSAVNDATLSGHLNRLNVQVKAYANLMNKEPKEVALEFINAQYKDVINLTEGAIEGKINLNGNQEEEPPKVDKVSTDTSKVPTENQQVNIFNIKAADGSFTQFANEGDAYKAAQSQIQRYVNGEGIAKNRPVTNIKEFLSLYRPESDWQGQGDITQADYEQYLVDNVLPKGSTALTTVNLMEYIDKLLAALAKIETNTTVTPDQVRQYLK